MRRRPRPRAEIETARLLLRPVRGGDGPALERTIDAVNLEVHGWDEGHRHRWVRWAVSGTAGRYVLVVCEAGTGRVVGSISAAPWIADPSVWSLGLLFGSEGRGRGYGAESLVVAVERFHEAGARGLTIETAADNLAMRRVAERAGFVEVQAFVHHLPDGRPVDSVRYAHARTRRH